MRRTKRKVEFFLGRKGDAQVAEALAHGLHELVLQQGGEERVGEAVDGVKGIGDAVVDGKGRGHDAIDHDELAIHGDGRSHTLALLLGHGRDGLLARGRLHASASGELASLGEGKGGRARCASENQVVLGHLDVLARLEEQAGKGGASSRASVGNGNDRRVARKVTGKRGRQDAVAKLHVGEGLGRAVPICTLSLEAKHEEEEEEEEAGEGKTRGGGEGRGGRGRVPVDGFK